MSGGGIGGTLGSLAGAALAPETGGLSIAIPALAGAVGGGLGGMLTHSKNPLLDAFMGGVGGGISGAAGLGSELGISDSAGLFGDSGASGLAGGVGDALMGAEGTGSLIGGAGADNLGFEQQALANAAMHTGTGGTGSGILNYLGRQAEKNPLNLALAGGSVLSGVNSLLPHKQVNVGQNAAQVMATSPGFGAKLPQYSMQNTAAPYQGDWYKYGFTPQPTLYNAQPQVMMKHGGQVKKTLPLQEELSQIPVNPLTLKAAHQAGVAVGEHLKQSRTPLGQVHGSGGGQDDAVPAKLSEGEYILSADIPSALGDGSTKAGAKKLDEMVSHIRTHKTSKGSKFPPKARNPLSYIPKVGA